MYQAENENQPAQEETPVVAESGTRLLSTEEIEAFEAISKEVFGSTSRWSTLLKKGIAEDVTDTITEYVPATGDKPEETKTHEVLRYLDAAKKSVARRQRYFTPESLMAYMQDAKKRIDEFKAAIAKIREEQRVKAEQENAAKAASGSSV